MEVASHWRLERSEAVSSCVRPRRRVRGHFSRSQKTDPTAPGEFSDIPALLLEHYGITPEGVLEQLRKLISS
jgi:hypothetical protein